MEPGGARGIRVSLLDRHRPAAHSLARYITGSDATASSIVTRSFTHCFARLGHLRDPQMFELQLLHDVIQRSRRRALRNKDTASTTERIVLHLAVAEQLPVPAIAELVGCSESRVRQVLDRDETWEGRAEFELSDGDRSDGADRRARIVIRSTILLTVVILLALSAGASLLVRMVGAPIDDGIPAAVELEEQALPNILNTHFRPVEEPIVAAEGATGGHGWVLRTYPAQHQTVCLEIRVDERFGSARCPGSFRSPITVFVAPDSRHSMTYIFGRARRDIESLTLTEKGGRSIGLQLHQVPHRKPREPAQMFVALLPDYLLHLSNKEQGRSLGYRVFELTIAATKGHKEIGSETIYLGRPP